MKAVGGYWSLGSLKVIRMLMRLDGGSETTYVRDVTHFV